MLLGKLYSEPFGHDERISLVMDDGGGIIRATPSPDYAWVVETYSAPLDKWEYAGRATTRDDALGLIFLIAR